MKSKFKKIAIATSLCSVLAFSSLSLADNEHSNHRSNAEHNYQQMTEKRLAKLTRKLGLSESQQADIKALKSKQKAQVRELKPAMKAFRQQVKTLMSADSFDEEAFSQLHASNQDTFSAMALIKAKSKFAMKSVLTQEQLEKFKKMQHKRSRR